MSSATDSVHLAQTVATAEPNARIVVTGGAGVGKTHLFCERLRSLTLDHGLSPGAEILAVSFTRAAVAEIRRRLQDAPIRVRAVRPVTFDSLATRALFDIDPTSVRPEGGYDRRIAAATEALAEAGDLGFLADVRHVLVDECQDLVGVRAKFVLGLLSALDVGYTIFGDPAQAIYGFSVEAKERPFLERLESTHSGHEPLRIRLEGNARARTEEARVALWAGPLLEEGDDHVDQVLERLLDVIRDRPQLGDIDEAAPLLDSATGQTAVLCRTNGEALLIAARLRSAGVPHRIQLEAEDRPLAAWLALVFQGWNRSSMARSAFVERMMEVAPLIDVETAWASITKVAGEGSDRIEVDRLRRALNGHRRPDDLLVRQDDRLVVSSIHRSKGLEFDRVVLVDPATRRLQDGDDLPEETRVLYVAMTRARDDVFRLARPEEASRVTCDRGRWRRVGRKWWMTNALEIRREDVDVARAPSPAVSAVLAHCGPDSGDIRLHLDCRQNGMARYSIESSDEEVGATSPAFWEALRSTLGLRSADQAPAGLVGGRVMFVESIAGSPQESDAAGLGTAGIWLALRLGGLASIRWHDAGESK